MESSERRKIARKNRHNRIRKKISGTATKPRLAVFRSSKHIYVQAIDDLEGKTLAASSTIVLQKSLKSSTGNKDSAKDVGKDLADKLKKISISLVSLTIISCGGGSSSSPNSIDIQNTPSSIYPAHPLVWESATPESVGMSSSGLEEAFDYVFQDGSFTQAAVVIKDGKLVYERYRGMTDNEADILASTLSENSDFYKSLYAQRDQNSYISSWSTAKSFTSFLIGIAVESGAINSIDDSASSYITEWSSDERSSITIKNLLDMRSGLPPACFNFVTSEIGECLNANDSSSGGNIVYADDQLTKCIDRNLATEGVTHPWFENGLTVYSRGAFQYSN